MPNDLDLAAEKLLSDAREYFLGFADNDLQELPFRTVETILHIMAGFACKYAGEKLEESLHP